MNKKTYVYLAACLVLIISAMPTSLIKAQTGDEYDAATGEAPTCPEVVQISFPQPFNLYTHARVSVSYSYSVNYSGSVPDATYGTMPYVSGSPTSETFDTNDVGVYSFHVAVRYDHYTPQIVTITFFSGDLTAAGAILNMNGTGSGSLQIPYNINSKGFDIEIAISASIAPHTPTADEIADAQRGWWQQNIDNMTQVNSEAIGATQAYSVYMGVFGVGAFAMCIFFYIRDRKKSQQIATLEAKVELLQGRKT